MRGVGAVTTAYYVVARDCFSNLQNSGVERFVIGMELQLDADGTKGRPSSAGTVCSSHSRLTVGTGSSRRSNLSRATVSP